MTFFALPPFSHVEEVYLFLGNFCVDEQGIARNPYAYWTFNPSGGETIDGKFVIDEMPRAEMEALRLPPPIFMMRSWGAIWDQNHLEAVRQFHWLCGFDPDSRQVAEFLNLPLANVHPGAFQPDLSETYLIQVLTSSATTLETETIDTL
jgi:hypothetical protein